MQDFTKLQVWQKAHNITINVYKLTTQMPDDEKANASRSSRLTTICTDALRLISQIRRSSVSIESNLAEGCDRDNDKEFARFIDISMGSSFELRCQLIIARDLGYIDSKQHQLYESKLMEVNRMLGSLLKKLRA